MSKRRFTEIDDIYDNDILLKLDKNTKLKAREWMAIKKALQKAYNKGAKQIRGKP